MTPRELAEKRELEMLVDYLGRRNFANAGEAAELKAALERAQERIEQLEERDQPQL